MGLVIPRYSPADMAGLCTDEARLGRWLEVELLAVEARPDGGGAGRPTRRPSPPGLRWSTTPSSQAVAERELVTDHDVAAFVDVVQEAIGQPAGSWVHHGLTSSDVVDTALCATLVRPPTS